MAPDTTGDATPAAWQGGGFELDTRVLGALPVVNAFIDRLALAGLLEAHLPGADARLR